MKNKIFTLSLAAIITAAFAVMAPVKADNNPPPKKCEKCYRGPDGKMKCETVPCPK